MRGWSATLLAWSLLFLFAFPTAATSPATPSWWEPVSHRALHTGDPTVLLNRYVSEKTHYLRVFPPDERERVTPTTALPASAVTLLFGELANGDVYSCSGTVIAPQVVLTAAHCLFSSEDDGWFRQLFVAPGADRSFGDVLSPYGMTRAVDAVVPRGWTELGEDPEFDFGLVQLEEPLGGRSGTVPLTVLPDEILTNPAFRYQAMGYPADKPFGTLWRAPAQGSTPIGSELVRTSADLTEGMSGGPLLLEMPVAVFGLVSFETPFSNVARRITDRVVNFVQSTCAVWGCSVAIVQPEQSPPPPPSSQPAPGPQPTPGPEVSLAFVSVTPERWSTVLPGVVPIRVTVASQQPLVSLIVRVAGQQVETREATAALDAWLDPGRHTIEAIARDRSGRELRLLWDIQVSWDLADSIWFDSRGNPKPEAINATARALVEAFRWHLYGMSWDGLDHRGDMPTHAPTLQPGEPVPVLVTEAGFDRAATEATLRALVEAFRWHLWGISWDGTPHFEVPTHGEKILPPEPVGPWFTPDGQPIASAISATLRSLEEAFRWHLYGATWDGVPHPDMPTHAKTGIRSLLATG